MTRTGSEAWVGEEDLGKILCRLAAGMSLTVPDEWLNRFIPGTAATRMTRINDIARKHGCTCEAGYGVQKFEKMGMTPTG